MTNATCSILGLRSGTTGTCNTRSNHIGQADHPIQNNKCRLPLHVDWMKAQENGTSQDIILLVCVTCTVHITMVILNTHILTEETPVYRWSGGTCTVQRWACTPAGPALGTFQAAPPSSDGLPGAHPGHTKEQNGQVRLKYTGAPCKFSRLPYLLNQTPWLLFISSRNFVRLLFESGY